MTVIAWLLGWLVLFLALASAKTPLRVTTAVVTIALLVTTIWSGAPVWLLIVLWLVLAGLATFLNFEPWRKRYLSAPLLQWFKKVLPPVSKTEQEALDAGTVWFDQEIFSGNPDWQRLISYPWAKLSEEEKQFIDGPVEELCAMINDWQVTHELYDLPPEVWQFIREKGFLSLIIPKAYGGLGFSAYAQSEVVMKIASRSGVAAVSVMVPNSLGPGELLHHYGTQEQKDHYLPRLAKGEEIPCFGLTNPFAGSDAAAIPDTGVVTEKDGVLGIRLNFEKRYITLAPVATLLGIAFKLYDPDGLLGGTKDLGITLALLPRDTDGVEVGNRHYPIDSPFQNGPIRGKDVFVPLDAVIGGKDGIGKGWRMLMECLAAGRAISLPALSIAAAKTASSSTGAYARIREQFKVPVGRFEGVAEVLGRIGARTYLMDSARCLTLSAIDQGEKPSVLSAICKYHLTERMRTVLNDALDVHGGKAVCLGPNNYLANAYGSIPVAITVEGANILTRSLIIFGQGAIRCHPYVLQEIAATQESDTGKALDMFDRTLFAHIGFVLNNGARSFVHALLGSWFIQVPHAGKMRRYAQKITRLCASFAFCADMAMLVLGGNLKRKEMLSARLGDVLSLLYLASATLKRYEAEGEVEADWPLVVLALDEALHDAAEALQDFIANFPNKALAALLQVAVLPFGNPYGKPNDRMTLKAASLLQSPGDSRHRLTKGIYMPDENDPGRGKLEAAFRAVLAAEPLVDKLRQARKNGTISGASLEAQLDEAKAKGVLSEQEVQALQRAESLRRAVIMVNEFDENLQKVLS